MSLGLLGWIGSWCLAVCGVPAAYKSYKDGHSDGLSGMFVFLWLAGEVLTLIYVAPKKDWPLIFNYLSNISLISVMVYYKLYPRGK